METLNKSNNTVANQQIKSDFISKQHLHCQTMLVDKALTNGMFDYEDIENNYRFNVTLSDGIELDLSFSEREELIAFKKDELEKLNDLAFITETVNSELFNQGEDEKQQKLDEIYNKTSVIYDDLDLLDQAEQEPCEVYEWWLVPDNWFVSKLKDQEECLLINEYGKWWGRQTTGQAIALDGVINAICQDLNLLNKEV